MADFHVAQADAGVAAGGLQHLDEFAVFEAGIGGFSNGEPVEEDAARQDGEGGRGSGGQPEPAATVASFLHGQAPLRRRPRAVPGGPLFPPSTLAAVRGDGQRRRRFGRVSVRHISPVRPRGVIRRTETLPAVPRRRFCFSSGPTTVQGTRMVRVRGDAADAVSNGRVPTPSRRAMRENQSGGDETAPRANILLVDDQPANLLSLEAVLTDLGQNLVSVRSGDDALRLLLQQDFAVILLDVKCRVWTASPPPSSSAAASAPAIPRSSSSPPTTPATSRSNAPTSWAPSITSSSRSSLPSCGPRRPSSSICSRRRSDCAGWSGASSSACWRRRRSGRPRKSAAGARARSARSASRSSTRQSWPAWARVSSPSTLRAG